MQVEIQTQEGNLIQEEIQTREETLIQERSQTLGQITVAIQKLLKVQRIKLYIKNRKIPDITSSVLIKEAVDTVESYQGLMSLYEMYYGIDLRTKDVGPKLEEEV